MVAEALVEAGDHGKLDRDGHWHAPGRELRGEADVQIVELVVERVDDPRCVHRTLGHGIACARPDRRGDLAHALDQASAAR